MADAPWRCSNCGTVNEPVANACRTCGRWPSMFDLEQSAVDQPGPDVATAAEPPPEDFEAETYEEPPAEVAEPREPSGRTSPADPQSPVGKRRLIRRVVIPLAVVIYLVVRAILGH